MWSRETGARFGQLCDRIGSSLVTPEATEGESFTADYLGLMESLNIVVVYLILTLGNITSPAVLSDCTDNGPMRYPDGIKWVRPLNSSMSK